MQNSANNQPLKHTSMQNTARTLNVCPNKLFAFLRKHNILQEDKAGCAKNTPFDKYRRLGYFHVELEQIGPFREVRPITRVTAEGFMFIQRLLNGYPKEAEAICRRNKPAQKNRTAPCSTAKRAPASAATG